MKEAENVVQIGISCVLFYITFKVILSFMNSYIKWFQQIPLNLRPNTALR